MTVHTIIGKGDRRRMIPPFIEPRRKLENLPGTKLNAVTAPLATLFKNMYRPFCNLYFI